MIRPLSASGSSGSLLQLGTCPAFPRSISMVLWFWLYFGKKMSPGNARNRENQLMWDKVLGAWFQCHVPWGCCGAGEGSGGDAPGTSWGWGQAVQFFLPSKQPTVGLSILPDPGASREPCARLDMARLPAALRLTRCMQMSTQSAEQLLITYQRRELHGHPILMHSWMSFLHTSVLSACIYGYRERHGDKAREEHIYKVDCIGVQRCIYTQSMYLSIHAHTRM